MGHFLDYHPMLDQSLQGTCQQNLVLLLCSAAYAVNSYLKYFLKRYYGRRASTISLPFLQKIS
jgi:hypothetical protein